MIDFLDDQSANCKAHFEALGCPAQTSQINLITLELFAMRRGPATGFPAGRAEANIEPAPLIQALGRVRRGDAYRPLPLSWV